MDSVNWKYWLIKSIWAFVLMWVFIGLISIIHLLLGLPNNIGVGTHHWVLILLFIALDIRIKHQLPMKLTEYDLLTRFTQHFFPLLIGAGLFLALWEWADLQWSSNVNFITAYGYRLKWAIASGLIAIYVIVDIGSELLKKWRDSLAEAERFQKENIQTRLDTLKTQINPHFLFNSLNTLSGLIHEDQDKASYFLRKVSGVYRHILEARDKDLISLQDELDIANDYIELIRVRFEGSIQIKIEIEKKSLLLQVVPLSIQMLIENAIKHNRATQDEPLEIEIFTIEGDWLVIRNNRQERRSLEVSTKVGLKNIEARFLHVTPRKLKIVDDGQRFEIQLPLISKR